MTVEEWKRKNPPIRRKRTTNADRFRSMSDEELSKYFTTHAFLCPDLEENKMVCKGANFMANDEMCKQCWLNWLRQDSQMDIY